jgi:hypothetical protein
MLAGNQQGLFEQILHALEDDGDVLIRIAHNGTSRFRANQIAYATISGSRETWPLEGLEFSRWLRYQFYREKQRSPKPGAIKNTILTLAACAQFEAEERKTYYRVAEHGGKVYFDLGDAEWNIVEIGADGWRVICDPPVKFSRPARMVALPLPQRGGSIDQLRALVNFNSANFDLYLGALIDPLDPRPRTRPFVQIIGPEGWGKTSALKVARNLLDPMPDGKVRAMPQEVRDVFVNARDALLLTYDNIGKPLSREMSDTCCQITSGTGFARRKLFSDAEEATLCTGTRMFMVTSRGSIVTEPDLAERLVKIFVAEIEPGHHLEESQFDAMFERDRAQILGALFDRVSCGLGRMPTVRLSPAPRIADAACWATACELVRGAYMRAYWDSIHDVLADVVEQDGVILAIDAFMHLREDWNGTATQLLAELENISIPERPAKWPAKWKDWPRDPAAFGRRLTTVMAALRKIGIECTRDRATESDRTRHIQLHRISPAHAEAADDPAESRTPTEPTKPDPGLGNPDAGPTAPEPAASTDLAKPPEERQRSRPSQGQTLFRILCEENLVPCWV